MMTNENLIALVYSKPEIWDQSSHLYSSKDKKFKAWMYISEKLEVRVDVAKARWTNLRDLFRRELKKTLRVARNTGDPEAYVPRWKHFRSMLFLKEQIVKDDDDLELPSLTFDDTFSLYPQTILDDGENVKGEDESLEEEYSPSSTPTSHMDIALASHSSHKRNADSAGSSYDYQQAGPKGGSKRQRNEDRGGGMEFVGEQYSQFASSSYGEMDEDYHFVMSILPSVRKVRMDRKTSFKMKILELIIEEEKNCSVD